MGLTAAGRAFKRKMAGARRKTPYTTISRLIRQASDILGDATDLCEERDGALITALEKAQDACSEAATEAYSGE